MIWLMFFVICSIKHFSDGKIIYGHKMEGFVLKSITQIHLKGCAKECRLRTACLSLNYNRQLKHCELNSVSETSDSSKSLTSMKEWVYSNVNTLQDINLGNCNSHNCVTGQACTETSFGYECHNEGVAPSSLSLENGIIKGNMNDFDSKILFQCFSPYVLYGPRFATLSEINGWSGIPACELTVPCATSDILLNHTLQITLLTIPSGNGQTVYTGPEYRSKPTHVYLRNDTNLAFQCTRSPNDTASYNLICSAGNWEFTTACQSNNLACILEDHCNGTPSDDCINDHCHCPMGSSYSYSQNACVPRCDGELATTFTKFSAMGMYGVAYELFMDTTYEDCLSICLPSTTCLSFGYGFWKGHLNCYIREVVTIDYMDDVKVWSGGSFHQRDCL